MRVSITDYYDIPQLRQLATTKIERTIATSWHAISFSNVVREASGATSDTALHHTLGVTAAAHIEESLELEESVTLDTMTGFTVGIITQNMIAADKSRQDLLQTSGELLY